MKTATLLFARALLMGSVFGFIPLAVAAAAIDPMTPGSAAMSPKAIVTPLPASPRDRDAMVRAGVWIAADGAVESVEVIEGTPAWAPAVVEALRRWRFEPVMWEGQALLVRTEITVAPHGK